MLRREKALIIFLVEINIKEIGVMIRKKEKEPTISLAVISTKEVGIMIRKTEKVHLYMLITLLQ